MPTAIQTLQNVLILEARRGYKNDAVTGGLERFAANWERQARRELAGSDAQARITDIVAMLQDYALLPAGARPSTIRHLQRAADGLGQMAARTQRKRGEKKSPDSPSTGRMQSNRRPAPKPRFTDSPLDAPLTTLPGIGPRLAETMSRLGLQRVGDLLWHLPARYQDYSHLRTINELRIGEEVTVRATVHSLFSRRTRTGRKLTTAKLFDKTGTIQAQFWNPYINKYLFAERTYYFSGKIKSVGGQRVLDNPEFEIASDDPTHTARIVPIYPLTEGLSPRVLRKHIRQVVETWAHRMPDPLPKSLLQRLDFPPLGAALRQIHFPDNARSLERSLRRLAFEELLVIQLGVLGQHRAWQSKPAQPIPLTNESLSQFLDILPFALTNAQQRTLREIQADLAHDYPMTRLLQGDVGSGKTVIAAAAMWAAVSNRAQAALMAPTEILAEQHYRKLADLFGQLVNPHTGWPVRVALLTGSVQGKKREALLAALAAGEIDLLIGTHALIQGGVTFHDLAVVVVDEQHRFGVAQRAALREKGPALNATDSPAAGLTPHTLVMSATPIPRTLALTIYGDMDVSVIDELPPGRQPIETYWVTPDKRQRIYNFVRKQVQEGRQVFIIYALVNESDRLEDVGAAVAEHKRLQTRVFPQLRVGLLHGKMTGKEKDAVMRAFAEGEYDVLVSTAVVEVGIDIPNASLMIIENADRFGLSQLHQFRGRVGRGPYQSYCILIAQPKSATGEERMRAMVRTQDGFELAEIDLRMRGPGEFFGSRQSGLPDLRLARLSDTRLLALARQEAQTILDADPDLAQPEHRLLAQRTATLFQQEMDLS
jgi:ATP-dependent DNA helicase RecG